MSTGAGVEPKNPRHLAWLLAVMVFGCGPAVQEDAGASLDGSVRLDAGSSDAGSEIDSGTPDAGEADAGEPDASIDGGVDGGRDGGPDAGGSCLAWDGGRAAQLRAAWFSVAPSLRTLLGTTVDAGRTSSMYDVQLSTAQLLIHADFTGDVALLESLAEVYSPPFELVRPQSLEFFYYAPLADGGAVHRESVWPVSPPRKLWPSAPLAGVEVGPESTLDVAQFLYATSRLVRATTELPTPSPALRRFVALALPVTLDDHYLRWVTRAAGRPGHFQVRGWGCHDGTFSHREHLTHLQGRVYGTSALPGALSNPPAYCNATTDLDLWIVAGCAELLAANAADPTLVPLSAATRQVLENEVTLGVALLRVRTVTRDGGALFDPGGFDGHPDYDYAGSTRTSAACTGCLSVGGCTCPEFPGWHTLPDGGRSTSAPTQPGTRVTWDISHARRVVSVFDTLVRHRWLTEAELRPFARTFASAVWNQDLVTPRFTTFADGSNGWYRVNYSGRSAFGYPPFAMTPFAGTCGYGFWKEFEPRLGDALEALHGSATVTPTYLMQALPELLPYSVSRRACR